MKLTKNHYLYVALVVGLVIISIMGTYIVMDARGSQAQTVPSITPTATPTVTPSPTVLPTTAPVKKSTNSATQSRLKEIDSQLATLQAKKSQLQESLQRAAQPIDSSGRPEGYNPALDWQAQIDWMESIKYDIRQVDSQINTLNAERTQLLINQ